MKTLNHKLKNRFRVRHLCRLAFIGLLSTTLYGQNPEKDEKYDYAQKRLQDGINEKDSVKIADALYLHAKIELRTGNNPTEAYRLFYQSLKISEKTKNYYQAVKTNIRLAELELQFHNPEGSREFLKEAFRILEDKTIDVKAVDPEHLWLDMYRVAGNIFITPSYTSTQFKPQYDSALHYFRKMEEVASSIKGEVAVAVAHYELGQIYHILNDKRALNHFEQAVALSSRQRPSHHLITYRSHLAKAYITFNRLKEAEEILRGSQEIIDSGLYNIFEHSQHLHYDAYSLYYELAGDYKNALTAQKKAENYTRVISESDRNANLTQWRARLETERKDQELRVQKQEIVNKQKLINLQQVFVIVVAILLSGLAVISYFLYKNYKKQKRLSEKNAVLIHEQNHRVKNNLQVISSLLNLQNDYIRDDTSRQVLSESQSRIDAMALLHRQLYENDQVELINIENLFSDIIHSVGHTFGADSLQLRLPLEVTRLGTDTATSVGLILNELTINSFKYAFRGREPVIEVSSRKNGNTIHIIYKDFGSTDLSDIFSNPDKKGFGLNLIDMILFQINGTLTYDFKNDSSITLSFTDA